MEQSLEEALNTSRIPRERKEIYLFDVNSLWKRICDRSTEASG